MNIANVGIKIPQITYKSDRKVSFTGVQRPDMFVSSRPDTKDAVNQIRQITTNDGFKRFSNEDLSKFKNYYKQNKIDLDTVKTFADTNLKISDMCNIYSIYQAGIKEGKDFKKHDYENIHKQVLTLESKNNNVTVEKCKYNNTEYSVYDNNSNTKYTYEFGANLIAKEHSTEKDGFKKVIETEDYRQNTLITKFVAEDDNSNRGKTQKVVIDYKNNNGKITHSKVTEVSNDVEGAINSKILYSDGTVKNLVKSSKDEKTGIITIKRDLTSPDGTRTEYLYEDDPQGNRIIDYKITDENGKVIYKNSQTFEKISDNKFISSNDSRKYEIDVNERGLSVKELGLDKTATINFKKKVENFNKNEMISLLKKIPGHMLFDAAEDVKKFEGLQKDEALLAHALPTVKTISSADNLFIFLHELGHIKDAETLKSKNGMSRHNEEFQYTGDKNIQKIYIQESKNFLKKNPDVQREEISYFLENDGHYGGKWGALSEVVAETNAIGSSRTTKDSECILLRSEYLQENFPKTIAAIKEAMRWKDDLDAIEFYGT